jgi:hypothetical protein
MAMIFSLLLMACGVASLICLILVLIKLFPAEGPVKGVLGIICGIYTFIWGWQNVNRFNLRQIMQIWTALIVAYFILLFLTIIMGGMSAATS